MDIKTNIKILCKATGTQLNDIAAALNESRQTLHSQITGNPTAATLERIAAALQVPSWIILHPAPLAALQQLRQTQSPAALLDQAPRPPVIFCPYCKNPLTIHAAKPEDSSSDQDTTGPEE